LSCRATTSDASAIPHSTFPTAAVTPGQSGRARATSKSANERRRGRAGQNHARNRVFTPRHKQTEPRQGITATRQYSRARVHTKTEKRKGEVRAD
jgi:hypothetical protein